MRKKLIIMITFFLMVFSATAFADIYQKYLNDDRNFLLCDGHMGTAWYVDLKSLSVDQYNPPHYMISINVLTVDADAGYVLKEEKIYQFQYNYDKQEMYFKDKSGQWKFLPRNGTWAETGVVQPAGKIAFKQAYVIPFYH